MKYPKLIPQYNLAHDEEDGIPLELEGADLITDASPTDYQKQHYWVFPRAVIEMVEAGVLQPSELMLLGHIGERRENGNFSKMTNEQLSKLWGKTTQHVSRTLAKFAENKLIRIKLWKIKNRGTWRTIWINWEVPAFAPSSIPKGGEHSHSPRGERTGSVLVVPTNTTGNQASQSSVKRNLLKTDDQNKGVFSLCQKFAKHVHQRHGIKVTPFVIQSHWLRSAEDLINGPLKGNSTRFRTLVNWYIANDGYQYLKICQSIVKLCRNFHAIEMTMHKKEGTSPEPESQVKSKVVSRRTIQGIPDQETDGWE